MVIIAATEKRKKLLLVINQVSVTVGFVELSAAHEYDAGRVLVLLLNGVV
jgi:hypothetical protein